MSVSVNTNITSLEVNFTPLNWWCIMYMMLSRRVYVLYYWCFCFYITTISIWFRHQLKIAFTLLLFTLLQRYTFRHEIHECHIISPSSSKSYAYYPLFMFLSFANHELVCYFSFEFHSYHSLHILSLIWKAVRSINLM